MPVKATSRGGRRRAERPLQVSGVFPHLSLGAGLGPPRSECGIGALMAWADRLWAVTYVSHKSGSGVGTGLYEIDADLAIRKRPESQVGTYTNRFVHYPSNQLIIGPHVIDADRKVRTIRDLLDIRLCATMTHLEDPEHKVYMLGMEGEFFEMDVKTLKAHHLAELATELHVPEGLWQGRRRAANLHSHFKAGHADYGRVVVAANSYDIEDFEGKEDAGRLGEWQGKEWRVVERKPFVEVAGRIGFGGTIFATGWDRASAILEVFTARNEKWTRYRLPKASHLFDHMWATEWPRIRETEHERLLMDCHGMFYELSPWAYADRVWGIRPISTHLWVLGDFCTWRGLLVLGADNASPSDGHNPLAGEPQSGLWFGKTDDLWSFGKPAGWGGPWWDEAVKGGEPSDPFLMTGFDRKVLHLAHDGRGPVAFTVEVDFLGCGRWKMYDRFRVRANGYVHHEFPAGFSAHWVRVTADRDCRASAYFHYT